ncbi:MAG: chaperone modulator CbpM [Pseudomonadales bacterium]
MSTTVLHISCSELCELEQIQTEVLVSIVEHGIAKPVEGRRETDWIFEASAVPWIKKAVRLAADLEIDWFAVALLIELMQQKEQLERENACYRSQLERFMES